MNHNSPKRIRKLQYLMILCAFCFPLRNHANDNLALKDVGPDQYKDLIQSRKAKILVVNFWATWCLPCRREFPAFVKFSQEADNSNAAVIFVSANFTDERKAVMTFLKKYGVKGESYLKTGKDGDFLAAVSDRWRGSLPATIIYGPARKPRFFHAGPMTYDDLVEEVNKIRRTLQEEGSNGGQSKRKEAKP